MTVSASSGAVGKAEAGVKPGRGGGVFGRGGSLAELREMYAAYSTAIGMVTYGDVSHSLDGSTTLALFSAGNSSAATDLNMSTVQSTL